MKRCDFMWFENVSWPVCLEKYSCSEEECFRQLQHNKTLSWQLDNRMHAVQRSSQQLWYMTMSCETCMTYDWLCQPKAFDIIVVSKCRNIGVHVGDPVVVSSVSDRRETDSCVESCYDQQETQCGLSVRATCVATTPSAMHCIMLTYGDVQSFECRRSAQTRHRLAL